MGCVSSKMLRKSGSFQEEVKQSKQRNSSGLEELLISKDGGDQFLALLCTANTVARRIKASSLREEPERSVEAANEPTNSRTIDVEEPDGTAGPENELANIETINAWELLAGLEEGREVEQQQEQQQNHHEVRSSTIDTGEDHKFTAGSNSIPSTNLTLIKDDSDDGCTVEDYDAMVAGSYSSEEGKSVIETSGSSEVQLPTGSESSERESSTVSVEMEDNGVAQEEKNEELELKSSRKEDVKLDQMSEKGLKRKAMAKELAALKVPAFEFSRTGSLREWLRLGGQVFSPGSYVTPKFGNFVSQNSGDGERRCDHGVFDPELVEQFEEAIKQLTMEEEFFLKRIIDGLEKGE